MSEVNKFTILLTTCLAYVITSRLTDFNAHCSLREGSVAR